MNVQVGVEVVNIEPTPVAVLGRRTDEESFTEVTLDGIRKVRRAVAAARVPTAGPPFVRYLSLGKPLELEIGLPLEGPHAIPTLRTTILPGGEGASLWHTCPREALPAALRDLRRWVERHATSGGAPWHWYWTEPDAEERRVQMVWPLGQR